MIDHASLSSASSLLHHDLSPAGPLRREEVHLGHLRLLVGEGVGAGGLQVFPGRLGGEGATVIRREDALQERHGFAV